MSGSAVAAGQEIPVQPYDPSRGKWTPFDSKRVKVRSPSEVKRAKSEQMDSARAKLCPASVQSSIPPPAWLAMGNSQACESRAPAPPTKKPGRVPWALIDSKRANARFSAEDTREKSAEIDAACAKLFPDGAEAKHAKSVGGNSARVMLVCTVSGSASV